MEHVQDRSIFADRIQCLLLHSTTRKTHQKLYLIELDDGKIYRKALYLMVKTMVSCRFPLKPIQ
jgi:hypothetical protein